MTKSVTHRRLNKRTGMMVGGRLYRSSYTGQRGGAASSCFKLSREGNVALTLGAATAAEAEAELATLGWVKA